MREGRFPGKMLRERRIFTRVRARRHPKLRLTRFSAKFRIGRRMKLRLLTTGLVSLLCALLGAANLFAECNVIPLPQQYREGDSFSRPDLLEKKVSVKRVKSLKGVPAHAQNEAYRLLVKDGEAKIEAVSDTGELNARRTLKMLVKTAGKKGVPSCKILDWPAYPMRGFMQDVGRSYIPFSELKREIDILADYKINVFHWHLTENQGWRLESKKFPQLNDKKNFSRQAGKVYTLKEAQELVKFCRERKVTLIPEIDMPGHSAAFQKTFGCDMQSEKGTKILKELLEEIITTAFPKEDNDVVPYIHIGTDEVKITNPNFVPGMVAFVRSFGKKVGTWNPGASYKPGEVDFVQMWSSRGRPLAGTPTVDSRLHYINHFDAFADPVALYFSQLGEKPEADGTIAGGIVGMWHDRYIENPMEILAQNGFYPNMLFFAESAWRGGRTKYFRETGTNIAALNTREMRELRDFERRLMIAKKNIRAVGKDIPFVYVPQADVVWRITEAFPNGGNLKKAFPPEKELKPEYDFDGKTYGTQIQRGAGIYLRHVWGGMGGSRTVATHYENPQPNHTAYAYTWVWSPKAQNVGLWAQTQNYSRSEKDLAPPQGKWDSRESRFWVNDKEILPPRWENEHKNFSNEIPLKNENFEVRPPLKVQLKQGWNKVLVKLPIGEFRDPRVRLVKWMFTFVFVSPDGNEPAAGLIYSPDKKK